MKRSKFSAKLSHYFEDGTGKLFVPTRTMLALHKASVSSNVAMRAGVPVPILSTWRGQFVDDQAWTLSWLRGADAPEGTKFHYPSQTRKGEHPAHGEFCPTPQMLK